MKRNPFNNQECIASEPALADHYSKYYLEIHGWHDRDICKTIDCHTCKSKGVSMDKYNVLANDKEDVLLLASDYPDFRDYQIMGTFYMDRECGEGNDYITIVHCNTEKNIPTCTSEESAQTNAMILDKEFFISPSPKDETFYTYISTTYEIEANGVKKEITKFSRPKVT